MMISRMLFLQSCLTNLRSHQSSQLKEFSNIYNFAHLILNFSQILSHLLPPHQQIQHLDLQYQIHQCHPLAPPQHSPPHLHLLHQLLQPLKFKTKELNRLYYISPSNLRSLLLLLSLQLRDLCPYASIQGLIRPSPPHSRHD